MTNRIEIALQKLRGNLVATPLIGGLHLPGVVVPADLRIKAECLQGPGGIWFRGALCELSRHLGVLKGVVVTGAARPSLAAAAAAAALRIPCVVVRDAPVDPSDAALLAALACEVVACLDSDAAHECATRIRGERGFAPMPGVEAEDYAAGIATVGLELTHELPRDTTFVSVSPASLTDSIRAGLLAGGRECAVHGIDPDVDEAELSDALRIGARVDCDRFGAAAFRAALGAPAGSVPCAILAS